MGIETIQNHPRKKQVTPNQTTTTKHKPCRQQSTEKMGTTHFTIQLHMQSPTGLSYLKQILASQTAWDLKRHTSCSMQGYIKQIFLLTTQNMPLLINWSIKYKTLWKIDYPSLCSCSNSSLHWCYSYF